MKFYISMLLTLLLTHSTYGQSLKFISQTDQDLSIKKIVVIPLVDNIDGIYSNPLTKTFEKNIADDKQWELIQAQKNITFTPEEFEEKPETVRSVLKKYQTDALLAGRISKGPSGITIKVSLYSGADGLPIASESIQDYQGFEIKDLNNQVPVMLQKLKSKVPYHGFILSRKGQLVTLNIGSSQGLKEGAELTAIQVIKVNRHPKYKFIVSTDTVILGKIKINKVDEYISFGSVTTERESNVISASTKFLVERFIQYPSASLTADGKIQNALDARSDSKTAFGDSPNEWVPETQPTFGKIGLMLGLGSYTMNSSLSTGSTGSSSPVTPSIHINGEMWFDPHWFTGLNMSSYVFSLKNNLSGSNPGTLNAQLNTTSLVGGYNFLMADDFFGPKLKLLMGYSILNGFIDNSTPTAFTSTTYSGLTLGISGSFPIELPGKKEPLYFGGKLNLFLSPGLSESPVSSGSSQNQITSFGVFIEYKLGQRMNLVSGLDFDLISSNFGGGGSRAPSASSTSQAITHLAGGIEYLF